MSFKYKYLLIIPILLAALSKLPAQEDIQVPGESSYLGRHFIVGYMQNEIEVLAGDKALVLQLYISSFEKTKFTVKDTINGLRNYEIEANSVMKIDVPIELENRISEIPNHNSIEINSEKPISVYCFSTQYVTSDAYSAIPISYWGKEYVVVSMANDLYANSPDVDPVDSIWNSRCRQSEFLLMAAYDSTVITFNPRSKTEREKEAHRNYNVYLNKGDCYLVKSYPTGIKQGDLTGTIINSNKPIGVLSGHVRVSIPLGKGPKYDSKDHICDMLAPVNSWGKKFVTAPFGVNDVGDFFKITSIEPETRITIKSRNLSGTIFLNNPGDFQEVEYVNEPVLWTADKPIQLTQMMMHNQLDIAGDDMYDPCMVSIPPVEQFMQRVIFTTPQNPKYPTQFVSHGIYIIADSAALESIRVDSTRLIGVTSIASNRIANTDYYWTRYYFDFGTHSVRCDNGGFTGIIFGNGKADSYAMVLGSALKNVEKPDNTGPQFAVSDTCGIIQGVAYEKVDSNSSGFDYLYVIQDSTYNFSYTIGESTDTSTFVEFSARPDDFTKEGKIVFEARDKNGNKTRYRYFHLGFPITIDPLFHTFDNLAIDKVSSATFTVTNYGTGPLKIDNAYLKNNDYRLSLTPVYSYPVFINPRNDTLLYSVNFNPAGDSKDLNDTLVIDLGCGWYKKIPITGSVSDLTISTKGWDFGEVFIGDTSCGYIYFANIGNKVITLTGTEFLNLDEDFVVNSSGLFPADLEPGDTLKVPVCFMPTKRADHSERGSFINDKKLINTVVITGTGVAPEIEPVVIDWGKRRIGTQNDSTAEFYNNGNADAQLGYDRFDPDDDGFKKDNLTELDAVLEPGKTQETGVSFTPAETRAYDLKSWYNTGWKLHPGLYIELKGEGTLPEIKTYDIDFDTVALDNSKDSLCRLFVTGGNENLTIDSFTIIGGDTESFRLSSDLEGLINGTGPYVYTPGSEYKTMITFAPKRAGYHELLIEVTHDAAPGYARRDTVIKLSGYCNYTGTQTGIEGPEEVIACNDFNVNVNIANIGMTDLELQQLTLSTNSIDARWAEDYSSKLPIKFPPDSTLTLVINADAKPGQTDVIKVHTVISDTIVKDFEFPVNPYSSGFVINGIDNITSNIGDTLNLELSGEFPYGTTQPLNFEIDLNNLDIRSYFLVDQNAILVLSNGGTEMQYNITAVQTDNTLKVTSDEPVLLPEGKTQWRFVLRFEVLLPVNYNSSITVSAPFGECYETEDMNLNASINEICFHNYRNFKYISQAPVIKVSPNPAEQELKIDINTFEDEFMSIDLINLYGKKLTLSSNLHLFKGSHSLIFEISEIPSGVYIVSVLSSRGIFNKKIVVRK